MATAAVVVFTAETLQQILQQGGSGGWRLDADRARRSQYLVCTQNRKTTGAVASHLDTPHGAAFLVGRIDGLTPCDERSGRWLIQISDFIECCIPNIWNLGGQKRYPAWYTTLEELGIDLTGLPPPQPVHAERPPGLAGGVGRLALPPTERMTTRFPAPQPDAAARLDAILAQLDRIPELSACIDALDWDEHGLPR